MDNIKSDPEIVKVFWWGLSDIERDVRNEIIRCYHREYNDFLNGEFSGKFCERLRYLINLDSKLINNSVCGNIKIVKVCVELGADIHADDDLALRGSAKSGQLEVVRYLVEKGADIHAKNDQALEWASCQAHLEVVKYLKSLI